MFTSSGRLDRPVLDEVGDDVYAYVQPSGGWCVSNAGVIVSGSSTLVVDTLATQRRAIGLRDAVRRVSSRPATMVVNTHHHGDHTFGNSEFTRRGAVAIGHEQCRHEMAQSGLALQELWPDIEWGDVDVVLPDVTFAERMTVHCGSLAVELIHPGVAHTTNDTVVWIPDRRVLFVGDIAMSGVTPFCLMGSVEGTLNVLDDLRALEPRTVVSGHGPVGGVEILDTTEAYLRWVTDLTAEGLRRGLEPAEAAATAELGSFAELLDQERLVGNLHRAYAEARGAERGAALDVVGIFSEMAQHLGSWPICHA